MQAAICLKHGLLRLLLRVMISSVDSQRLLQHTYINDGLVPNTCDVCMLTVITAPTSTSNTSTPLAVLCHSDKSGTFNDHWWGNILTTGESTPPSNHHVASVDQIWSKGLSSEFTSVVPTIDTAVSFTLETFLCSVSSAGMSYQLSLSAENSYILLGIISKSLSVPS